jgi:uncharacterized protein
VYVIGMTKFCRFELRTIDVSAARAFYTPLLGHDRTVIWPLHEQAIARGARSHWLGYVAVDDVERASAAFVEHGAERLGPTPALVEGGQPGRVIRDAGGAVFALAPPPASDDTKGVDVVWHVLSTRDLALAAKRYADLLGWDVKGPADDGALAYRPFAWNAGGPIVGVMADIAGRPEVHPHWLFFIEVADHERAAAAVRAAGGLALEPVALASGQRIVVCEDAQGAAFALMQR